jgi:hypothetical protein
MPKKSKSHSTLFEPNMVQFTAWTYKHIKHRSPNSANSVARVCCSITSPTYCERMSKTELSSFFSPLLIRTYLTKHTLQPRLIETASRHLSSSPAKLQYRASEMLRNLSPFINLKCFSMLKSMQIITSANGHLVKHFMIKLTQLPKTKNQIV